MIWKDPSIKKLDKYPTIKLTQGKCNEIITWFRELYSSPIVPPIFTEFVVRIDCLLQGYFPIGLASKLSDLTYASEPPNPYAQDFCDRNEAISAYYSSHPVEKTVLMEGHDEFVLYIQYNDENTVYRATYWTEGKKRFSFMVDYKDVTKRSDGNGYDVSYSINKYSTSLSEETVREEAIVSCTSIAAIQFYLLHHKPEEISEPVKERHVSKELRAYKQQPRKPIVVRSSTHKTIIIGENDRPPRRYNYQTMAWQVRGYYCHRGGDKHLVYMPPHIVQRGKKKRVNPQLYNIIGKCKEGVIC